IPYCFATMEVRERMFCRLWLGINLWMQRLGGAASAYSGHSLAFQEIYGYNGNPMPCFVPGTFNAAEEDGQWNPSMPAHTVAILPKHTTGGGVSASAGYKVAHWDEARHFIMFHPDMPTEPRRIRSIAHEVGHVFGMLHEHQRSDRDNYIEVQFFAMKGYDDALARAIADGHSQADAKRRLEQDEDFARHYDAVTDQFMKPVGGKLGGLSDEYFVDESQPFDLDSIMLYNSQNSAEYFQSAAINMEDATILKWEKDHQGNRIGTSIIKPNMVPSAGDVAWIRRNYPW
ncbi:hypothetical protein P280DRAFT_381524, partial [Massarina eburnea CBS 473.64]